MVEVIKLFFLLMIQTGLSRIIKELPAPLRNKRVGIVCHAASIDQHRNHILSWARNHPELTLVAVFGPQHGLYGQTQDNMIEWEPQDSGSAAPEQGEKVFSLYGASRTPTAQMLQGLDALIVDLQDVGARPYTYIWTIKNCMQACEKHGVALWVLDRPNPIGMVPWDGGVLKETFYSFVGGAPIPMTHRLTIGEIAVLLQKLYYKDLDLRILWMSGYYRNSLFSQLHLPWVLPSPNMPSPQTAIVYPAMVLLEATTASEGRGTTLPFELVGHPGLRVGQLQKLLTKENVHGVSLREHHFQPTFHKWQNQVIEGFQIHVDNPRAFYPMRFAAIFIKYLCNFSSFNFKDPPYEYETENMPIDILTGDAMFRTWIESKESLTELVKVWDSEIESYRELFYSIAHYSEEQV